MSWGLAFRSTRQPWLPKSLTNKDTPVTPRPTGTVHLVGWIPTAKATESKAPNQWKSLKTKVRPCRAWFSSWSFNCCLTTKPCWPPKETMPQRTEAIHQDLNKRTSLAIWLGNRRSEPETIRNQLKYAKIICCHCHPTDQYRLQEGRLFGIKLNNSGSVSVSEMAPPKWSIVNCGKNTYFPWMRTGFNY